MSDTSKIIPQKSKKLLFPAFIVWAVMMTSVTNGWTDYLGNPQRTAYSPYDGPDMPVILWRTTSAGSYETIPFIEVVPELKVQ
ncbi:MAG: hypothetical protein PVF58_22300 [Candidatus Methanofastidiosia archaeon]|jgi:hypothetical protein